MIRKAVFEINLESKQESVVFIITIILFIFISTFRTSDFYHTCYCLSGLSIAQHQISDPEFILGGPTNLLKAIDPEFNLIKGKADAMIAYFHL